MFKRCVQVLLSEKSINRNIFLSYVKSVTTSTKCFQDFSDGNSVGVDVEGSKSPELSRSLPIAVKREFKYKNPYSPPKQINLESLDSIEENKIGVVDLHSDVFGAFPRIDLIHQNVKWQLTYKKINYESCATRAEKRGGGRKPWPQKGSGRARHGSIRSPLWKGGGRAFGPRGPQSYFYMIPYHLKVAGLCSTLSVKLAQNNLHVVDSLELPSDEQEYIENLVEARNWGFSVLFVDDTDFMPRNISLAVKDKPSYNLMASYSLNVYSMLKHETLVLTLPALEKIEEKLVYHLNRTERQKKYHLTK